MERIDVLSSRVEVLEKMLLLSTSFLWNSDKKYSMTFEEGLYFWISTFGDSFNAAI